MVWKYFNNTFEFTKDLPIESSAWSGHYFFAYDLVRNVKPKVIVELGTHKGNSLFSMAQAIKDEKLETKLHGVDTWEGDPQAGYYGEDIYNGFLKISKKYYKDVNIVSHKMFFDDAVKEFNDNSIDILHIDGLHTYEAVKHDFETWLPKVKKDTGIIMFHDVCETKDYFGVYKLWEELKKEFINTITFEHYHGLGVVNLNSKNVLAKNRELTRCLVKYYNQISENKLLLDNIEGIKKIIEQERNLNMHLLEKNREYEGNKFKYESSIKDVDEFRTFKNTKIWKTLTIWRKSKKYFKNFFLNIKREGPIKTLRRLPRKIKHIVEYRKTQYREANQYKYWVKNHKIDAKKRELLEKEIDSLKYKPLISIVMPVYNVDIKWIKKAVASICNQIYTNWELCIADDHSKNQELIKYLQKIRNKNIKITFRKRNGNISEASNSALKLAKGDFIALMDNDDYIYPHALAEAVKVLNKNPKTDLIYSDEDKLDKNGKRVEPFFKPDWSPDFFMATNYLCHLTIIRRSLVDDLGGFRKGFEGSQDYDLFLRITEKTKHIEHISDILYSWRKIPGSTSESYSTKNYANEASKNALQESLKRQDVRGEVTDGLFPGSFRVNYNIEGNPLVSILVPTKDKPEYIKRCLSSLLAKTTYSNYEVILIDTGSSEEETLNYYNLLKSNSKIKIIHWHKKFNYSSVNNFGAKKAKGEYLILLNNDTEVISPNWIEGMLEHAQRENIGAVGVKLIYPDDRIQHAGVILGLNGGTGKGVAGHAFRFFPRQIQGFPVEKDIIKNYSAVTAACLMIKKRKFYEVGGLEEKFRIAFNDVDFCLKLLIKGYYNLYTPYVELYHHESVSVGTPESDTRDLNEFNEEINMMYQRWGEEIMNDPYYNKNLSLKTEAFDININN